MKIETINDLCTGCMACESACPVQCISCEFDKEGFYFPTINHTKCIECGKCERVCHILNPTYSPDLSLRRSFYGYSKNDEILRKSTSGGAFYHLSQIPWAL